MILTLSDTPKTGFLATRSISNGSVEYTNYILRLLDKENRVSFVLSKPYEPRHEISNNVVLATSIGSDQPAHTRRLIRAFASRLNIL